VISSNELQSLHNEISDKFDESSAYASREKSLIEDPNLSEYWDEYVQNSELIAKYGTQNVLTDNGFDENIVDELTFFIENENNPDVYNMLVEKFKITSKKEATDLFQMFVLYKDVVNKMNLNKKEKANKPTSNKYHNTPSKGMTYSCALAITGTLVATAAFVYTGGLSAPLYWALVGKSIATLSVIDSCK
jgi:hypothetical protein